jgi:hypothetical protein
LLKFFQIVFKKVNGSCKGELYIEKYEKIIGDLKKYFLCRYICRLGSRQIFPRVVYYVMCHDLRWVNSFHRTGQPFIVVVVIVIAEN